MLYYLKKHIYFEDAQAYICAKKITFALKFLEQGGFTVLNVDGLRALINRPAQQIFLQTVKNLHDYDEN